jgi:GntR family transcriptional regulator
MMHIQIKPQDGLAIYLQIARQVKYLVASGRLAAGDEIPPIRTLAEQLAINPNTVARAYLELEQAGIVYKRPGTGTFVAEVRSPLTRRDKVKILAKSADQLLTEAYHLGVPFAELLEILTERNQVLQPEEQP